MTWYVVPNIAVTLTLPQGESQAGSPGLLAFHKAKSLSDLFSPRSWLNSPERKKIIDQLDK